MTSSTDVAPLSVSQACHKALSDAKEIWTTLASCEGHEYFIEQETVLGIGFSKIMVHETKARKEECSAICYVSKEFTRFCNFWLLPQLNKHFWCRVYGFEHLQVNSFCLLWCYCRVLLCSVPQPFWVPGEPSPSAEHSSGERLTSTIPTPVTPVSCSSMATGPLSDTEQDEPATAWRKLGGFFIGFKMK